MKSRAARRREARYVIAGEVGAVIVLSIFWAVVEGVPDRWIDVVRVLGTGMIGLGGVALGYWLNSRERRQDEQRRRRALATGLLSEVRFLEGLLRDIDRALAPAVPGEEMIEPYRTAVYESAGANLLLLSPETVHALNGLYQLVYRLGAELQEIRLGQINASVDHYHSVRLRAVYTAYRIPKVAARLRDQEGGMWPDPLPYWRVPYPDLPPFPPPIFEDNDPQRRASQWP